MLLDSARSLKLKMLARHAAPFLTAGPLMARSRSLSIGATSMESLPTTMPTLAVGIAPKKGNQYNLAVRCQRPELLDSPEVAKMAKDAKGEIDIRFVGRLRRFAAKPWYQKRGRPVLIGHSCGHYNITAGTLGCFVKLIGGAEVHILSNNHVLAAENKGKIGDAILQPGQADEGRNPADIIATLAKQVKLKKGSPNLIDAAIALLNPGIKFEARTLKDFGQPLAGVGGSFIDEGTIVAKQGRTTGLTRGKVTAFELDNVVVEYGMGNLSFDNQIEIEGADEKALSEGGDSGSVIFEESTRLAIALLFAGGDIGGSNGRGLTYANTIHAVLDALKIELI